MTGQLVEKTLKYTEIVLPESGVKMTGVVKVRNNKVYCTEGMVSCEHGDEKFSFSLNQSYYMPHHEGEEDEIKEPTLNTPNWPASVPVNATLAEFKAFVIADNQ